MRLNSEKIRKYLRFPVDIHLYESVGSTNDEAKRRAETDGGVCLYAAQRQTRGRGRRGRSFYSPKNTGLYMTLAFPLSDHKTGVQRITCAAAVAVCEAVEALSDKKPQIKWVNDIFLHNKKVAGILTELLTDSKNQPRSVIVGIGLNLNTVDFPQELADKAGNLGELEVNALCGTIANNLVDIYRDLGNNSIIEKYKQRSNCIDRTVTYFKNGTAHTARAVDIDRDGGLVVEEKGETITLDSGEISVKLS